jgi:hypothetical protein
VQRGTGRYRRGGSTGSGGTTRPAGVGRSPVQRTSAPDRGLGRLGRLRRALLREHTCLFERGLRGLQSGSHAVLGQWRPDVRLYRGVGERGYLPVRLLERRVRRRLLARGEGVRERHSSRDVHRGRAVGSDYDVRGRMRRRTGDGVRGRMQRRRLLHHDCYDLRRHVHHY